MPVLQLHPVDVDGEVDGRIVVESVAAAQSSVTAAAAVPVAVLSVVELADGIAGVAVLESQLGALRLSLLAEADRRKVAWSSAATGTDAWAAQLTGSTRAVMAGGIWLARMLADRYAATREAFADGGINEAQVRAIVTAAERLPCRGRCGAAGGCGGGAGGQGGQRHGRPPVAAGGTADAGRGLG